MKRFIISLLQREIDLMNLMVLGLILAAVAITAKVMTEKVQTEYDYFAMEAPEAQYPAL